MTGMNNMEAAVVKEHVLILAEWQGHSQENKYDVEKEKKLYTKNTPQKKIVRTRFRTHILSSSHMLRVYDLKYPKTHFWQCLSL